MQTVERKAPKFIINRAPHSKRCLQTVSINQLVFHNKLKFESFLHHKTNAEAHPLEIEMLQSVMNMTFQHDVCLTSLRSLQLRIRIVHNYKKIIMEEALTVNRMEVLLLGSPRFRHLESRHPVNPQYTQISEPAHCETG